MSYYIGVDIGGTNIACGIVSEDYKLLSQAKVKTNAPREYKLILEDIVKCVNTACKEIGITPEDTESIGVGCPGMCSNGVVEYSNNLGFYNVPLRAEIEKALGIPAYLDNDANAAAFGEFCAGAASKADSAVVITLGTGVGSGIIIDGKIYRGANSAGGETGHTVIVLDGLECSCGRRGCFEAYASAKALMRMTSETAARNPESLMAKLIRENGKSSARIPYLAMKQGCPVGKAVTEQYVKYLSCGIANVINIFQPDILCIGGGVCNEGDALLIPLRKAVSEQIFSKNSKKNTEIAVCSLGNDAGIIGAAMLFKAG